MTLSTTLNHFIESTNEGEGMDTELVQDAMRSGEWLRTQWIARVAFGLGDAEWTPADAARIKAALARLQATGAVESRDAQEERSGDLYGHPVSFAIPRREWRLTDEGGK